MARLGPPEQRGPEGSRGDEVGGGGRAAGEGGLVGLPRILTFTRVLWEPLGKFGVAGGEAGPDLCFSRVSVAVASWRKPGERGSSARS